MRVLVIVLLIFLSCKKSTEDKNQVKEEKNHYLNLKKVDSFIYNQDPVKIDVEIYSDIEIESFVDSSFVLLKKLDTTFLYSMKYATKDNFLNEVVYDCDDCLIRYKTAKQLIKANNDFKKLGYRIQFFDCYRPLDVQKKMWKIFPDKRYVADPNKGSNHNRGTAVDITLVNKQGDTLVMGTPFDFFGRKAHHAYSNLPIEVLNNRKLLKTTMEKHEFWPITSEWWHYNLNNSYKYPISNVKTKCDD